MTAGLPTLNAARIFLSIDVVRRRIDGLERQTGATLLSRSTHIARLTEKGALTVSAVERREAASCDLMRASDGVVNAVPDEIRVAVTGELGRFWLAPRLVEFQQSPGACT